MKLELRHERYVCPCPVCKRPYDEIIHNAEQIIDAGGVYCPRCSRAWTVGRLKCLSVRQPWAWLIVNGHKDIENRTRFFSYRGPVLIHAGKQWHCDYNPKRPEWFQDGLDELAADHERPRIILPAPDQMQRGGIVGIANINGCTTSSESPWFEGPFGLEINDTATLNFMPYSGQLGLFEVDYVGCK